MRIHARITTAYASILLHEKIFAGLFGADDIQQIAVMTF